MKPPEEVKQELYEKWIRRADEDLGVREVETECAAADVTVVFPDRRSRGRGDSPD